jgi:hypothetical protein
MDPATGMLIATGVSLISGWLGSKKASKSAKKQAAEEARLEGIVTEEKVRQLGIEERVLRGDTMARYAGSGVMASGPTPGVILAEQAKEFAKQRDVTKAAGASKVASALGQGKATADAYRFSGYANVASGISNMLTSYSMMKG